MCDPRFREMKLTGKPEVDATLLEATRTMCIQACLNPSDGIDLFTFWNPCRKPSIGAEVTGVADDIDKGGEESDDGDVLTGSANAFARFKHKIPGRRRTRENFDAAVEAEVKRWTQTTSDDLLDLSRMHPADFIKKSDCVLAFWRSHHVRCAFPFMHWLARRFVAVPATTCSCERLFSGASLMAKRRGRAMMSNETLSNSMMVCAYERRKDLVSMTSDEYVATFNGGEDKEPE